MMRSKRIISAAGDSLVVLDEAYIAFTENAGAKSDYLDMNNLIILRSMTKDYALAGLRLGYAIAPEPVISVLNRVRPPWNVSSAAQAAGIMALKAAGYLEKSRKRIIEGRKFLAGGLKGWDLHPCPRRPTFPG